MLYKAVSLAAAMSCGGQLCLSDGQHASVGYHTNANTATVVCSHLHVGVVLASTTVDECREPVQPAFREYIRPRHLRLLVDLAISNDSSSSQWSAFRF